jgi:transposase-like protein
MKASLGDLKAWRAELRAEDVPRRPPPSSRPVLQPEERSTPDAPKRRVVIPLAELERAELEAIAEELGEPSPFAEPPKPALVPQPQPQNDAQPLPEATEVAKKKQFHRFSEEEKADIVARVLKDGRPGAQARVALAMGTSQANVSTWVKQHRERAGAAPVSRAGKTLASNGAPSGHANGALPPAPTVTLAGLEEYIRALVAQQVAAEFRRRLQGMAD